MTLDRYNWLRTLYIRIQGHAVIQRGISGKRYEIHGYYKPLVFPKNETLGYLAQL